MLSLLGRLVWGWGSRNADVAGASVYPPETAEGEAAASPGVLDEDDAHLPCSGQPEEACNPQEVMARPGSYSSVRSMASSICPPDGVGGEISTIYRLLDTEPEFFAHRTAMSLSEATCKRRAMAPGDLEEVEAVSHRKAGTHGSERQGRSGMGRVSSHNSMASSSTNSGASTASACVSSDGGGDAHKFYRLLDVDPELRAVY
jgi:hypothetical protein